MNIYSPTRHTILSTVVVATLAGVLSGGLPIEPPAPAANLSSPVSAVRHQDVLVLPEITVSAPRLPS